MRGLVVLALLSGGALASDSLEALKGRDPFAALPPISALNTSKPVVGALPNFAQVSAVLYRSGQPTQQGIDQLAAKGIKTILKVNFDEPAESGWASADGIALVSQLMSNRASPSYAEIDAALAIIDDPARQPVLVHCHHGSDRTGAIVAAYRVTVQGMSVADAAAEAKSFGYGAPGFDDITSWLNGYLAYKNGN